MKQKTMLYKAGKDTIVDAADEEALKALLDDGWTDSPQPKADEPKADEPKADEPKADEPKADEPKADEPVKPTKKK